MAWGPLYDPKYGALVKIDSDPKVYLLLGGKRYWITSEVIFESLNYLWDWIENISNTLLDKYQMGSEISEIAKHPNYTIVKYIGSPKVYRLEPDALEPAKQIKRHIINEKVFEELGFRWDRIVTIEDSENYPDGEILQ